MGSKKKKDPTGVNKMLKKEVALQRLGSSREIANLAAYLASPISDFASGSIWTIDGGQVRSQLFHLIKLAMTLTKFDLTKKNILITGGAGLLGIEHASAILEVNGTVILADVSYKKLEGCQNRAFKKI